MGMVRQWRRVYLELLVEEAHRGDPGSDDSEEGGSNDGHGPLNAAQAQQQCLSDPAGTCNTPPHHTQACQTATPSPGTQQHTATTPFLPSASPMPHPPPLPLQLWAQGHRYTIRLDPPKPQQRHLSSPWRWTIAVAAKNGCTPHWKKDLQVIGAHKCHSVPIVPISCNPMQNLGVCF